mmetsp:Transcript_13045/g.48422  ORF Transcript_13045/g.48422 Transcript_13045/m.48422 type:complete len:320 (-) Transcript_13045:64-1023(-)
MSEMIRLRRHVRAILSRLKGVEPDVDVRVPLILRSTVRADLVSFPVQQRGDLALYVADVNEVDNAHFFAHEEWSGQISEGSIHATENFLKVSLVHVTEVGAEAPLAPRREQLALEAQQLLCSGHECRIFPNRRQREIPFRIVFRSVKDVLQRDHDPLGVRHELAVQLHCRKEPVWDLLEELLGFGAIAPHVDLLDAERDALLLQQKPRLLAVGAPSCRVAIERDSYVLRAVPKEPHLGVSVCSKVTAFYRLLLGLEVPAHAAQLLLQDRPGRRRGAGHFGSSAHHQRSCWKAETQHGDSRCRQHHSSAQQLGAQLVHGP